MERFYNGKLGTNLVRYTRQERYVGCYGRGAHTLLYIILHLNTFPQTESLSVYFRKPDFQNFSFISQNNSVFEKVPKLNFQPVWNFDKKKKQATEMKSEAVRYF